METETPSVAREFGDDGRIPAVGQAAATDDRLASTGSGLTQAVELPHRSTEHAPGGIVGLANPGVPA